jgi:hypothetical protein
MDISDRMVALREYHRRAKDRQPQIDSQEIVIRAARASKRPGRAKTAVRGKSRQRRP